MNEEMKPQSPAEQKAGCIGMLAGLALVMGGGYWLVSSLTANPESASISSAVRANPAEYAVARNAINTVLRSCGTIEMVTPASNGGYVIDCSNGDRYRMATGSSTAVLERR